MIDLRPATIDDATACQEIYAPFVTDNWVSFETEVPSVEEVARRIATYSSTHAWIIAEINGVCAGYAYGTQHRSRASYRTSCDIAVYVKPAFVRCGIGRALYTDLLPRLRQLGYHAAFAGIALPNAASIGLHEAMGFTLVGIYREVGWKYGSWRDVSWWQRLL